VWRGYNLKKTCNKSQLKHVIHHAVFVQDVGIHLRINVSTRSRARSVIRLTLQSPEASFVLVLLDCGHATLTCIASYLVQRFQSVMNNAAFVVEIWTCHSAAGWKPRSGPTSSWTTLRAQLLRLHAPASFFRAEELFLAANSDALRVLRSTTTSPLNICRMRLSNVGDRASVAAAVHIWNRLSQHVTSASTVSIRFQSTCEDLPLLTLLPMTVEWRALTLVVLGATVCKTVRLMLSDLCLSVCPVSLSLTLVHCGQTVAWIKMKLRMAVGLDPGHIVSDGDRAPLPKRAAAPQFSAHLSCAQTAGWIKIPLGREAGFGPGDIVLDGGIAPPCLVWPNGSMDQDATWYGDRPWPMPHCVTTLC